MFHGGTNFGFTAGANLSDEYKPFVTSYDYDALLTEWGDVTAKYQACQRVLAKHGAITGETFPAIVRRDFGAIEFTQHCSLHDALPALSKPIQSAAPQPMETLGAGCGYVLYQTTLPSIYRGETLVIRGMHDWCQVMLNGKTLATWYRNDPMLAMPLQFDGEHATLEILVTNLGRSNFGHRMMERKGITEGVFVGPSRHDERAIFGWTQFSLPLEDLRKIPWQTGGELSSPSFHRARFTIDTPADTFLHLPGWKMGCAFVNGINIGRHWSIGPQRALYVPGPFLKSGENDLILFECGEAARGRAELRAEPDLG
jgi:beta-galactosidase